MAVTQPLKIKTIRYGRTFSNGEFEFSRIDATIELLEGDDPEDALYALIDEVEHYRKLERKVMK